MRRIAARAVALAGALLLAAAPAAAGGPANAPVETWMTRAKADMLKDPALAATDAAHAQEAARAISDPQARACALAAALWLRAEALSRIENLNAAAVLIARAETTLRHTPHSAQLAADVLLTSGSIHAVRTEVTAAFEDYQAAHRLFQRAGDRRKQAITLAMIAILYYNADDFATSLHYVNEALEAYPTDPGLAQSIYNSRGNALVELGRFEAADQALTTALRYARQLRSRTLQATILENIARERLLAGRLPAADAAIAAARVLAGDDDDNESRHLDAIAAQAALQHGRPGEAEALIDRTFSGLDLAKTDVSWHDAHKTAVAIYTAQGQPAAALAHLRVLKRLDDDSTKLATQTSNALLAVRFDTANQQAKIVQLRDAARLREAREALVRARTERLFWLGGAGATATVIVLLLIGLFTIRRSRDQVRAVAADLAVTNGALGKALAAKTEFLATTSHEIRTPLNGILGMAQVMLADRTLPESARERLGILQTAGLSMRTLVDDILDMAKVETGHLTVEQAPFDLPEVLADAARMWTDQARDKGVQLVVDLAGCPARVLGDAARVRQIACNLLSNAFKFTAAGSVTLAAVAREGGVEVSVTDTGIGIAPDKLEMIFESFRQADASTTRQFGGTGLGLAICRSLARAMGGDIGVTSRPGEGSTFTATLRLPMAAPEPARATEASGDTLLVIDRNPITRAMLRTLLLPRAGDVAVAGTIAEAAARLEAGDVAQVLIDEGAVRAEDDANTALGQLLAAAGDAPVALLWPAADRAGAEQWQALGIAQVIGKPITGPALVEAVFGATDNASPAEPALVSQAA